MNRNWSNQKANPALKTKTGNKQTPQIDKIQREQLNEILTPVCLPHLQNNGTMELMHDGAPSHTARFKRALLQANRIKRTAMAISIAGFKFDRAHLGRNWPKG